MLFFIIDVTIADDLIIITILTIINY